jgi:hypothetical protein
MGRSAVIALIVLMAVAPAARADETSGRIHLTPQGRAVLRTTDDRAVGLVAARASARPALRAIERSPGELAVVRGRRIPHERVHALAVDEVVSPVERELRGVVCGRAGALGEIDLRTADGARPLRVLGPLTPLLRDVVGCEVRVRTWSFLDADGDTVACSVEAVWHDGGRQDLWVEAIEGEALRGSREDGQQVRLPRSAFNPVRLGSPGHVAGTLARDGQRLTVTTAKGEVFDVRGGEGVLPPQFVAFVGKVVDLQGLVVRSGPRPAVYVEWLASPSRQRLTGSFVGPGKLSVGGRTVRLLGRSAVESGSRGSGVTLDALVLTDGRGRPSEALVIEGEPGVR